MAHANRSLASESCQHRVPNDLRRLSLHESHLALQRNTEAWDNYQYHFEDNYQYHFEVYLRYNETVAIFMCLWDQKIGTKSNPLLKPSCQIKGCMHHDFWCIAGW